MSKRALRHSIKGTTERLRQVAIENRHPAGVKESAFPVSQEAIREAITAQLCPWCGRGPFAMLPVHTNKTHGIDKWELRDLAGLTTQDPLCSEEARAKMAKAYDCERGATVRSNPKRPSRWTQAGIHRQTETITTWMRTNPQAALTARNRALAASLTPEAIERRRQNSVPRKLSAGDVEEFRRRMASPEVEAKRRAARKLQGCGTRASYRRGCRCGECRAANARKQR